MKISPAKRLSLRAKANDFLIRKLHAQNRLGHIILWVGGVFVARFQHQEDFCREPFLAFLSYKTVSARALSQESCWSGQKVQNGPI
jgi:hypothetical protein